MWCCKNYIKVWKYWINRVLLYKLDRYSKTLIHVTWTERRPNCVSTLGHYTYSRVLLIFFPHGLNTTSCRTEAVNGWRFKVTLPIASIMHLNKRTNLTLTTSVWCIWMPSYTSSDAKWSRHTCFSRRSSKIGELPQVVANGLDTSEQVGKHIHRCITNIFSGILYSCDQQVNKTF